MKNFEQLNLNQRSKLEALLKTENSLAEIAEILDVSRQTLYRELLRNSYETCHDVAGLRYSCMYFQECRKNKTAKAVYCEHNCIKYKKAKYECLSKFPFTCNYCKKRKHCVRTQRFYDADTASIKYHTTLKEVRNEIKTTTKEFNSINKTVSPLINKGQSVEAILMNHKEIKQSAVTIRSWINKRLLDCSPTDFRLSGRRKPSKSYDYTSKRPTTRLAGDKIGHKYTDYLLYIKEHPNALIVQLDTVIGNVSSKKSVLTIHLVQYKFQFGFLIDEHSSKAVNEKVMGFIDKLSTYDKALGTTLALQFKECLLTDNGPEFDGLLKIDDDDLHVFYCRPYSSFEKGACERNHVLIRYIHHKGISFDSLTQKDINKIFSHINSYPRKSLNKKTPYQCVSQALGKEFIAFTGIKEVNCDDVNLTPSLVK